MVETSVQISRQDPDIEKYRLGLLQDVQEFTKSQIAGGMPSALNYQVAGLSQAEQNAVAAGQGGIGQFQPYVSQGGTAVQGGQNIITGGAVPAIGQGLAASQLGVGTVQGTGYQYDPNQAQAYMNPYEDQVVQQTMADMARQGQIQQQGINANAVQAGAFGGSRQAIANQEYDRNMMDQMARTAGQLRQTGYGQAQTQAQQAYESAMGRRQQEGQILGQLGTGIGSMAGQYGQLGSSLGQLGVQQAGIGQLGQDILSSQMQNAFTSGGLERSQNQAALDASRMTNTASAAYPYQQYGFLSDIYAGTPTSQSTTTMSSTPQVSPFQTVAGLGIAGLSAAAQGQKAGLF